MPAISGDWEKALQGEFRKPYYRKLFETVGREYRTAAVYPPADDIFNAFHLTPLPDVKVVILGQDPYHEPGQAHGLAFSVKPGVKQPPSLENIFKELHSDLGIPVPPKDNGCLIPWAEHGVLLLNSALTVREHQANSHHDKGWEQLTDQIIRLLDEREKPLVFILWGGNARRKKELLHNPEHLILEGPHPSPLSAYRGFFGGKYFSKANDFLKATGQEPVDWNLQVSDS